MESNLHNFNSPVSNISTIVGTNINKSFDLLINNIHSFKNILETLGEKSIYRWNDVYIWDDVNIWSDVELN